ELAALAAFSYWAARVDAPHAARIALAILAPILVAIFWGLFVSPKARFSSGRIGQVWLGLLVFLFAAAALVTRGEPALGVAFAAIAAVSSALLYALPQ
ncbi:MAG TPA: YrdB family protein, partial [Gemmatimonadaceae bacterium]|nr:YrdB family protein [Gemmatimonadaceae bacterium]